MSLMMTKEHGNRNHMSPSKILLTKKLEGMKTTNRIMWVQAYCPNWYMYIRFCNLKTKVTKPAQQKPVPTDVQQAATEGKSGLTIYRCTCGTGIARRQDTNSDQSGLFSEGILYLDASSDYMQHVQQAMLWRDRPAVYKEYAKRECRRMIQPKRCASLALDVISTTSWFLTNLQKTSTVKQSHYVQTKCEMLCACVVCIQHHTHYCAMTCGVPKIHPEGSHPKKVPLLGISQFGFA